MRGWRYHVVTGSQAFDPKRVSLRSFQSSCLGLLGSAASLHSHPHLTRKPGWGGEWRMCRRQEVRAPSMSTRPPPSPLLSLSQAVPSPSTERMFSHLCASLQCPAPTPPQQTQGRQLQAGSWRTCSLPLRVSLLVGLLNANYKRRDPNDLCFFFQQVLPAGP